MNQDQQIRNAPVKFWPTLLTMGPGIVIAAGVIGSGELINTPLQAAKFGFVLFWAVILSCVIKYFLQVEVGRYCLTTNQTIFQVLCYFPGPKMRNVSWFVWIFMFGWIFAQIGASGLVGAMSGLFHGITPLNPDTIRSIQIWGILIVAVAQLILWKSLYQPLEKIMVSLTLILSISAIVGLIMLQGTPYKISIDDIFTGLSFSLGDTDIRLAAFAVISLLGALGVSGTELIAYPYWILEKGYGRYLGSPESTGWVTRAQGWVRILKFDVALATLLATVITCSYFLLGAAILFKQGQVPSGIGVVEQISIIFTESYGPWAKIIFFVSALATLFSTLLAATAVSGRIVTDFLCTLNIVDRNRPKSIQTSHKVIQSIFLWLTLILYLFFPERPGVMVILSHYIIGVFGTPLVAIAVCWMAFRINRSMRMSQPVAWLLVGSAAVIIGSVVLGLSAQSGLI